MTVFIYTHKNSCFRATWKGIPSQEEEQAAAVAVVTPTN